MNRLPSFIASAIAVGLVGVPLAVQAQVRGAAWVPDATIKPVAAVRPGSLEGFVRDDRGMPVSGAAVSAIGPANKIAIADAQGQFRVGGLPPGPYVVRAHFVGYTPSRRQVAEVRPSARTTVEVAIHRTDGPRLLAAGLVPEPTAPASAETPVVAGGTETEGNQTELAWRLRHLQRSVLKGRTDRLVLGTPDEPDEGPSFLPGRFSAFARAAGSSARFASTLFGNLDLSGEINLLTTGSFNHPTELFGGDPLQRAVAYLSLHGTAGSRGAWTVQGIMTQGDVGSWVLAGSYRARGNRRHLFDVGTSFSTQRFLAGTGSLAAPSSEGSRSAGMIYVVDRWKLSRHVTLTYGGRYARYSYLDHAGFFSPSVSVAVAPIDRTRVLATVSRRVLAPGAEEFMPSFAAGLWVPPARTFEQFETDRLTRGERTLHYEVAVERDLSDRYMIAVRGFYQHVTDQAAALFGVPGAAPGLSSHYSIASTGDVSTRGWSVGVSNAFLARTRGTVTYGYATADWLGTPAAVLLSLAAPSVIRPAHERFHDLTTSLETRLPAADTRLVVFYRLNSAFSREVGAQGGGLWPGFDGRFDVQVTQPLRFLDFTTADWQVLLAVRNLFRERAAFESVYDELLVIAPPKRIVGGVLVRF